MNTTTTKEIKAIEQKADEIFLGTLPFFDDYDDYDESGIENNLEVEKELEDIVEQLLAVEIIDDVEVDPPLWISPYPELQPIAAIYAYTDMVIGSARDYGECYDQWQEYWEKRYNEDDCGAEQSYIRIKEAVKKLRTLAGDIKTECSIGDLERWKKILLSIDPESIEDDGSETGDFEQNQIFTAADDKCSYVIDKLLHLKTVNGLEINDEIWNKCFSMAPHMLFMGSSLGLKTEHAVPDFISYVIALIDAHSN